MGDQIYVPKSSCPRDRGVYQCPECRQKTLVKAGLSDYPVEPIFCGENSGIGRLVCGFTHMGYTWCDDCKRAGKDKIGKPVSHAGQYEFVAQFSFVRWHRGVNEP